MPEKRDYYEILGVPRNATEDEIKKAYRRLAKENHPDLHPNDKQKEQAFKEINEAYEVLSDPQKKSRYDSFGHAGVDPNYANHSSGFGSFDFGDLGDIIGDIFGSSFGFGYERSANNPNAPRRGNDVNVVLALSFEEAAKGCRKKVTYSRIDSCTDCGGTGAAKGTSPRVCSECRGNGYIRVSRRTPFGMASSTSVCPGCKGSGKTIDNPCPGCSYGRLKKTRTIEVDIPAGIDDNQTLTVRGQGDVGINGGPSGNLNVTVNIRPHPVFERDGFDVWCEIPITFAQAALGDEITVHTLTGKVKYTVPEGTQNGTIFRLKGKGIKMLNRHGYGDQYVKIFVEVPKNLTAKQKELLKQFDKETSQDKHYQNRKTFFEKIKDAFSGND